MSFQILHEMPYDHEDFVDNDGNPYFKETGEHKIQQVMICDLRNFDFSS